MLQQGAVLQPHWRSLHEKARSSGGFKALSLGVEATLCARLLLRMHARGWHSPAGWRDSGWTAVRSVKCRRSRAVSNHRGEALVKKAACPRTHQAVERRHSRTQSTTRPDYRRVGGEQDWDLAVLPGSVLPLLWCDLCLFMYHYFGHWHVRMLLFSLLYGLSQSLHVEAGRWVGGWLCSARRGHQGETEHRKRRGCWDCKTRWLLVISFICHASISVQVTLWVKRFNQQICLVSLQDALKGFGVNKMDWYLSMVK